MRLQKVQDIDIRIPKNKFTKKEMDSVQRFLSENAALDHKSCASIADVTEQYREWCREEGLQPLPASAFNVALKDEGCQQTKSGNVRYWDGLKRQESLERGLRYAQGM